MIPIHKLRKLPRHQRLRKIANLLDAEDARLASQLMQDSSSSRGSYLVEVAQLLAEDQEFSPEAREAVAAAASEIAALYSEGSAFGRRPINSMRHIVNEAVGKQTADWDLIDGEGRLSAEGRTVLAGLRVYLEDIRSPYNVGSIFRAAESFGAERLYLSPLCASPDHPRAARSSMGCTRLVPWERARLEELEGPYFALETGGMPVDEFPFPASGVLIVGSEELGVSPEALALAETGLGRVSIPTIGAKGSLNVSVAFGIAMREWCARLT